MPLAHHAQQSPLLSVYYHFVNAASSTPPLSPRSSCGDSETDAMSALSRESSVSTHLVRDARLRLTLTMPTAELPFPLS